MRPRRQVLLLMAEEGAAPLWRLRLWTSGFAVLPAATLDAAQALLWGNQKCDVVVTEPSFEPVIPALLAERPLQVLLLAPVGAGLVETAANAFEPEGPAMVARVLDRIKTLSARKRGPRKLRTYRETMARKREYDRGRRVARRQAKLAAAAPERPAA